jgi:nucleoside-diphosphate-sugar epimerase
MKSARPGRAKQILVTGGAGYLGSVVVAQLIARGLKVRVLDAFLFGDKSLDAVKAHPNCELIRGDVRDAAAVAAAMKGCDALVHLAAIVGDAACDENQQLAAEVNGTATRILVEMAPACGVRRFIFASSCSVYGASDSFLDETSALNPLSVYARTKIDSENLLLAASNGRDSTAKDFSATVLRFGTLFGLSPRMRFDLVVNLFAARAASEARITVFNAEQWRPFVHVEDAARAVLACLDAPPRAVSGEVFNAGSPTLNLQIRDVGDAIQRMIPATAIDRIENSADRRNYRVSFDKIQRALGFECQRTLESGIEEICATIRSGQLAASAPRDFAHRTLARAAAPA